MRQTWIDDENFLIENFKKKGFKVLKNRMHDLKKKLLKV